MTGAALASFGCYLPVRAQAIHFNFQVSNVVNVKSQGSVLDVKEFISYTEDIFDAHNGLCRHSFTDDTQACVAVPPVHAQMIAPYLRDCIADSNDCWYGSHRLQFSAWKTELIRFGSTYLLGKLSQKDKTDVTGNDNILPADSVRDLAEYLAPNSVCGHTLQR